MNWIFNNTLILYWYWEIVVDKRFGGLIAVHSTEESSSWRVSSLWRVLFL